MYQGTFLLEVYAGTWFLLESHSLRQSDNDCTLAATNRNPEQLTSPWLPGPPGGGGDLVPTMPGCVCPKVKDMGPFSASREWNE